MKYFIVLSIFLIATQASATYLNSMYIADPNSSNFAAVNSSSELETFIGSDSNVCKESGGNLAEVVAELAGTIATSRTWTLNSATDSVTIAGSIVASNPSVGVIPSPVPSDATLVGAKDPSGNLQALNITASGNIRVDGSGVIQPVSGSVTVNTITNYALEAGGNLADINGKLTTTANGLKVDNSGVTQPISAATLPLPSGASTSALQSSIITVLGSPFQAGGNIGNTSFGASQSGTWTVGRTWSLLNTTDSVNAVQSGTWNLNNISGTISLPTGAATSALQSSTITTLGSPFQAGGSIGNTSFGISGSLPGYASTPTFNLGTLNGAATATNQTSGSAKTQIVDGSGNVVGPVSSLGGVNYSPVVLASSGTNGSTVPARTLQVGGVGLDGNLHSFQADASSGAQKVVVIPSSYLQTYSACYIALPVPASPTDIFFITGSPTKTITVLSDQISGTETTVAMHLFQHIIRNSADSGGSCAGASIAAHDQNNTAATATVQGCSTSPTSLGGSAGIVQADAFVIPASTGVDSTWPQIRNFAEPGQGQGIVLRGAAQGLYVNINAAIGSGVLNWCVTWTEQ